jgi:peroxisomal 3,2-trans-enoyl-CoA isomerase
LAQTRVQELREEPDNDTKLKLYALYKQATVGTCTVPKPGILDFVAKAKWEAWSQLTGMEKSEAEVQYVQLVDELLGRQESQGETSDLVTTIEDGVMTIKFNRPKKKNALSIQVLC